MVIFQFTVILATFMPLFFASHLNFTTLVFLSDIIRNIKTHTRSQSYKTFFPAHSGAKQASFLRLEVPEVSP
jgi:hypothetical protein